MRRSLMRNSIVVVLLAIGLSSPVVAQSTDVKTRDAYEKIVTKSMGYLASKGRAADGSYSSFSGPAVTALVTSGILKHGRSPDDPMVAPSLKYIEKFVQLDGGIYQPGSNYLNYETCAAILCLTAANQDGRYNEVLKNANAFVRQNQWDEGEDQTPADLTYGGAGYGKSKRPDLSNTSFFIDALKATASAENDEALRKALIFVSRCQNLESEFNTTGFSAANPDGGFYYTPSAGGSSPAGKGDSGGLRSYGSMTYAGLKSMIYAGVRSDDKRVQAAVSWIRKHYDLKTNPGMGDAGIYFYFHTFAKTLDAMKLDEVEDQAGVKHAWRSELIHELAVRQREDGGWVNTNERWMEGDPNLVTGYVLLTLSYCKPK